MRINKKKNNRVTAIFNGFTLVELLVVIVIMGIITAISIPLVRQIAISGENKKYRIYHTGLTESAKSYTDSYTEDMFGYRKSGCAYIPYKKLYEKTLIKDIQINGISCDTEKTYVKVIKINEQYKYTAYLSCGTKKGDHKVIATKQIPSNIPEMDETTCGSGKSSMYIEGNPETTTVPEKKRATVKLGVKSSTGIYPNISIYYGWSKAKDSTTITDWQRLKASVPSEKTQNDLIFKEGKEIEVLNNVTTPGNETGNYYLVARVDTLYDLARIDYSGDKYVYFGPYRLDNIAPELNDSKIISKESRYNTLEPKLNFKATDNYTPESDLKICISYDKDTCKKTAAETRKYDKYKKNAILPKISDKYDGKTHNIHVTVADRAGNFTSKTFKYQVAKEYKLTYDSKGGSTCSPSTKNGIENNTWGSLCSPTKTGYNFKGWNTKTDGSGTTITANSIVTGNLTVYAQWEAKTYKISYISNGGKSCSPSYKNAKYGSTWGSLCTPTRTGYKFRYWNTKTNGSGSNITANSKVTENITVYAQWEPNSYRISFNSNGGTSCSPSYKISKYGSSWGILCSTSKTGYTFKQWNTRADGSGSNITASSKVTGDTTVYAQWQAKPYKLSYNSNKGNACYPTYKNGSYGSAWGTLCTPTRTGYDFIKWNTNASGSGTTISSNTRVTGDKSVYAQWQAKSYTLTYNSNGGNACNPARKTAKYDSTWGSLCTPTRAGYVFKGWNTNASGSGTAITAGTKVTGNITVYAKWHIIHSATFHYINGLDVTNGAYKTVSCTAVPGKTCTITTPGIVSFVNTAKNGCSQSLSKLFDIKGWSTSASATTATVGKGASLTLSGNANYYSIITANSKYVGKHFRVKAHTCNKSHSSNVWNRSSATENSTVGHWIREGKIFKWTGKWAINSGLYNANREKDNGAWLYLIGRGVGSKACHKKSTNKDIDCPDKNFYIKSFQVKFYNDTQ